MSQVAEACVKVLGELHMELDDHAGEVATDEPVAHADQGAAPEDGASGNAVGGEAPGQAASAAEAGGTTPASGYLCGLGAPFAAIWRRTPALL